ncbi:MAG: alkaline phosphatase family protein [Gemmatimonadaceae bacterium]
MNLNEPYRRVILVILDGLRADAIDVFGLDTLQRLRKTTAHTSAARTVEPSVTWAVMTSLMTGVAPAVHGVVSERIHLPRPKAKLHPLPATLDDAGLPSTAVLCSIPRLFRPVASAIGRKLGVGHLRFVGEGAEDILESARDRLADQRRGLIFLHWPDADAAGHDHGWMSPEYANACNTLDRTMAALLRLIDLENDPETLLIALADHGGGGIDPKDHESSHAFDRLVPLYFMGAGVTPGDLGPNVSLLDVPATILWSLGVERPTTYSGRPLTELIAGIPLSRAS